MSASAINSAFDTASAPMCWVLAGSQCVGYSSAAVPLFDVDVDWPQLGYLDGALVMLAGDHVSVRDATTGAEIVTVDVPEDTRWAGVADGHFWLQRPAMVSPGAAAHAYGFRVDGSAGPVFELPAGAHLDHGRGGSLTCWTSGSFDAMTISVLDLDGSVRLTFDQFAAVTDVSKDVVVSASGDPSEVRAWTWSADPAGEPTLTTRVSELAGLSTGISAFAEGWLEVHVRTLETRPVGPARGAFQQVETVSEVSDLGRVVDGELVATRSIPNWVLVIGADPLGAWCISHDQLGQPGADDAWHLLRLDEHLATICSWQLTACPMSWCCSTGA